MVVIIIIIIIITDGKGLWKELIMIQLMNE